MVADPGANPVTSPVASTVATLGSLLVHVTVGARTVPVPSSWGIAVSRTASPTATLAAGGVTSNTPVPVGDARQEIVSAQSVTTSIAGRGIALRNVCGRIMAGLAPIISTSHAPSVSPRGLLNRSPPQRQDDKQATWPSRRCDRSCRAPATLATGQLCRGWVTVLLRGKSFLWGRPARRQASDAPRAHDDVVEVALLRSGRTRVPIILEEHGVDAVRAEGPEPVQPRFPSLERGVDPVLEHTVRLPRVVEPGMRFHTIPLAHVARVEQGRHAPLVPQPPEVGEIVVARGQKVSRDIGARRGIEVEVAGGRRIAPQLRQHRFRPVCRAEAERPRQLVSAASDPAGLIAHVQPPIDVAIHGRPGVHGPESGGELPHREMEPAPVHLTGSEAHTHAVRPAEADAARPHELASGIIVLEVLAQPVLLEIVTPDPARLGLGALRRGRWRRWRRWWWTGGLVPRRASDHDDGQRDTTPPASAPMHELGPHRSTPRWKSLISTRVPAEEVPRKSDRATSDRAHSCMGKECFVAWVRPVSVNRATYDPLAKPRSAWASSSTQRSMRAYTRAQTSGPCSTGSSIPRDTTGSGSKSPSSRTPRELRPNRSQIMRRCSPSMTTMRSAARTRSAMTSWELWLVRSTPRRAAAATASAGVGRPGPAKPAESTRTRPRPRSSSARRRTAAAKGLRKMVPLQITSTEAGARSAPASTANTARRRPLCSSRSGTRLIRLSSPDTNPRSIGTGGLPRGADTIVLVLLEEERCISGSAPGWSARYPRRSGRVRSGLVIPQGQRACRQAVQQGREPSCSRLVTPV